MARNTIPKPRNGASRPTAWHVKRMADTEVYGLAVAEDSELQATAGRVAHQRAEQYALANS